jgi:hypothetical protein
LKKRTERRERRNCTACSSLISSSFSIDGLFSMGTLAWERAPLGQIATQWPAAVADAFSARDHFRKPVSVLELDDDHGAFTGADAVLLALGFVDDQKSHSFFHLLFSFIGQDNSIYGTDRKRYRG